MMRIPIRVVQEGGYRTRTPGVNARHFFRGLWQGAGNVVQPANINEYWEPREFCPPAKLTDLKAKWQ
ncbi:MAG: hypothetical protein L0Y67_02505 [Gammaproteobacteria bacterium]|nr:hypothetical protein [Gammaproteobacteria bacterium]MCI0590469.1 hypothetical protein [Gammaproteobacteria bacterium]